MNEITTTTALAAAATEAAAAVTARRDKIEVILAAIAELDAEIAPLNGPFVESTAEQWEALRTLVQEKMFLKYRLDAERHQLQLELRDEKIREREALVGHPIRGYFGFKK